MYTLTNLSTIVQHRHAPHNIIKHIHAKILESALERQNVMR